MFGSIASLIKDMSKMLGLVGVSASLIFGVLNVVNGVNYGIQYEGYSRVFLGLLIIILGCLGSLILAFLVYGFGQLIENTDDLLCIKKEELLMNLKSQIENETMSEEEFQNKRSKTTDD